MSRSTITRGAAAPAAGTAAQPMTYAQRLAKFAPLVAPLELETWSRGPNLWFRGTVEEAKRCVLLRGVGIPGEESQPKKSRFFTMPDEPERRVNVYRCTKRLVRVCINPTRAENPPQATASRSMQVLPDAARAAAGDVLRPGATPPVPAQEHYATCTTTYRHAGRVLVVAVEGVMSICAWRQTAVSVACRLEDEVTDAVVYDLRGAAIAVPPHWLVELESRPTIVLPGLICSAAFVVADGALAEQICREWCASKRGVMRKAFTDLADATAWARDEGALYAAVVRRELT